jgi:hypothetical protein
MDYKKCKWRYYSKTNFQTSGNGGKPQDDPDNKRWPQWGRKLGQV